MADRPESGDDDESTPSPEVTTPPWLRSGPAPEQPLGPAGPTPDPEGTDDEPLGGRPGRSDEAAPNRITLGARPPARSAPEPEGPEPPDDDLSTLPLRTSDPGGGAPDEPVPEEQPSSSGGRDRAAAATGRAGSAAAPTAAGGGTRNRTAWFAVAATAVLVGSGVLGFFLTRGVMDAPADDPAECAAAEESDGVVGDGPGSLDSPAGAVLAFDHAYYVDRSAEKAFEAVSPSSRMSEEQVRTEGIDRVPEGTTHCVEVAELSPTLLDVTLTEFPPDDEPPIEIRQRIRVAEESDGTWGIVSITPAG